jgi:hypothetical protein
VIIFFFDKVLASKRRPKKEERLASTPNTRAKANQYTPMSKLSIVLELDMIK